MASIFGQGTQIPISSESVQSTSSSTPSTPKPPSLPQTAPPYDRNTINLIGPKSGYSPHIGTIVTMLTWMELSVLRPTLGLKQQDLDFLFDKNANTIGALMLHLAATEVLYQRMTFNNENFEKFPPDYDAKWGAAMNLGDAGRSSIKGHDIAFYQDTIREVREKTLSEFAKRDDNWFLSTLKEPGWGGRGPYQHLLSMVSRLRAYLASCRADRFFDQTLTQRKSGWLTRLS